MRGWLASVFVAAVVGVLLASGVAQAATITVNTTADELNNGVCSLREAVMAANTDTAVDGCVAGSGADVIVVPAGTYDLRLSPSGSDGAASGDFNLTAPVTIEGAGAATTVIDARNNGAGTPLDRLFHVTAGGAYTISGVTLQDGQAPNAGGALAIDDGTGANVTLQNSVIAQSTAPRGGGGVYNGATLSLVGVTVQGNTASGENGGGIANDGVLTVTASTVSGNTVTAGEGGGIWNDGSTSVSGTTIDGNSNPTLWGGGITNTGDGTLLVRNSTISNNTAWSGAGLYTIGMATTVTGVTVANNVASNSSSSAVAGGIYSAASSFTLANSTLLDNSAQSAGGGLDTEEPSTTAVSVTGTMIAGNHAMLGSGIYNTSGTLNVTDSTITANGSALAGTQGGGIYNQDPRLEVTAILHLLNDTLAVNSAGSGGGDELYTNGSGTTQDTIFDGDDQCEGPNHLVSTGNNLINVPATNCWSNADPTSISVANPKLGLLKNNGGPTQTMALLSGSLAIDAGASCAPADQRGAPRPGSTLESGETAGTACDIGAYERATCLGVLVNHVGTNGRDTINAGPGNDGILALGGNDTINPGGGSDGVCAGKGNDTVTLQDGATDHADGGPGTDTVTNHDPSDVLTNFEIIH